MYGWQAKNKRTCALPVVVRAMPENEKPPAMRVDIYSELFCILYNIVDAAAYGIANSFQYVTIVSFYLVFVVIIYYLILNACSFR